MDSDGGRQLLTLEEEIGGIREQCELILSTHIANKVRAINASFARANSLRGQILKILHRGMPKEYLFGPEADRGTLVASLKEHLFGSEADKGNFIAAMKETNGTAGTAKFRTPFWFRINFAIKRGTGTA